MVAMHVANEHSSELRQTQIAAQELMLSAFSAIKQPQLSSLGQPQSHGRNIAGSCWYARAGAEKGDLQGLEHPKDHAAMD